jgi:hypothetical protein
MKIPIYKRRWNKLTPRQKSLRVKSLAILNTMRNTNKTIHQATSENNISTDTVMKNTNGLKKENGIFVAKRWDRIPRIMKINSDGKEKSIEIKDSRTASVVGRYHNAIKQFLNTGDKTRLQKFRNKKVKDAFGNIHRFETDTQKIIRINERIEEPEFYEVYHTR